MSRMPPIQRQCKRIASFPIGEPPPLTEDYPKRRCPNVFTVDDSVQSVICPRCAITYPGYRREGARGRGILDGLLVYWPNSDGVFEEDSEPPACAHAFRDRAAKPARWTKPIDEDVRDERVNAARRLARENDARAAQGLGPKAELPALTPDETREIRRASRRKRLTPAGGGQPENDQPK
jgi:hypothetical protein